MIEIGGLVNLIAANESQYQSLIAAEAGFSNPPTVAQVQALIDRANSSVSALDAVLSSSLSQGNDDSGALVTAEQLNEIIGLSDVIAANESLYQSLIATETGFSNPPTVEEIQAIIDSANASAAALQAVANYKDCLLYTSPSPRDRTRHRMPSSA